MSPPPESADQSGGVSIGTAGSVGGDIVGGDKIVGHTKKKSPQNSSRSWNKKELIRTAEKAGLERQVVIKIAQGLKPHESLDFNQALKEIEHAVDIYYFFLRAIILPQPFVRALYICL